MASPFLRQCSRPAVKALLKQAEPRLYLEGDALYEEVRQRVVGIKLCTS